MDIIKLDIDNNVVFRYRSRYVSLLELRIERGYYHTHIDNKVEIFYRDRCYTMEISDVHINEKKLVSYTMDEIVGLQGKYLLANGLYYKEYCCYLTEGDSLEIVNYVEPGNKPISMIGIMKIIESGLVKQLIVPANFQFTTDFPSIPIIWRS